MRTYTAIWITFFALAIAGCSSNIKMTSSWKDKNNSTAATHIKKVLVIGLFGEKSRALRMGIENQMADNLKKLGYDAVTSYQTYGPKQFVNISEDHAMRIVDSSYGGNYDGVIVVSIIDKNSSKSYVQGYYSSSPYYGYGWGYSPFYRPMMYQPGYYKTNNRYSFETNFYDTNNKKMLYSGQSDVVNPSSPNTLAIDYSRIVLKDMRKQNILG